jgi:hypothetical protein
MRVLVSHGESGREREVGEKSSDKNNNLQDEKFSK